MQIAYSEMWFDPLDDVARIFQEHRTSSSMGDNYLWLDELIAQVSKEENDVVANKEEAYQYNI